MIIQTHQLFYINSANRTSGNSDCDFTYTLPIDVGANYDKVCLLSCSIPKSFYVVQDGFNTFTLKEGIQLQTITLPPGNYSYLSFMAVLPPLLNTASPNGWTYSMTYPNRLTQPDTGKFTYSVTGNTSQPSFITTSNVYEQLGLAENSTNTFSSDMLVSTSVINFSQETTLYIHSDCCTNKGDDILQEVYDTNSPPMSFIVYENTGNLEAYSKEFRNNTSRGFRFSLTNENNRQMNLHGRNMLMTIVVYKKDNINEVFREVIKANLKQQ